MPVFRTAEMCVLALLAQARRPASVAARHTIRHATWHAWCQTILSVFRPMTRCIAMGRGRLDRSHVIAGPRDCGGQRVSRSVTKLNGTGSCYAVDDVDIFWANELCARNSNM